MQDEAIISWKQLKELQPYSRQHILRMEKEGRFPGRVRLGPNRIGWRWKDIRLWLDSRE